MMLVRSAGRRQQRHTSRLLASSFAQLNLPWLAPAQLRWSASHTASSQPAPRPRRRSGSKISQQAKAQIRQLATSADPLTIRHDHVYQADPARTFQRSSQDANIPWDFSKSSEETMATLRPYSDPIIINNTTTKEAATIKVQNGVVGTAMDLLQHLYTTLRVGRMSRAEAIIQRLSESSHIDSPEVLHAHTAYLEELLRHLAAASSADRPSYQLKMQRWFEVEVFRKGVQPDVKILVVMTRAAIRGLQGSRRDRTIRRYVEMANQLGEIEYDEVLSSEDYDDNEFTILGAATSEFYEEIEPDSEELASQKQEAPELDMKQFRRLDPISHDELPEILATEQKGEGLETVKKSLEAFTQLPALPSDAPIEAQRVRAYERQRIMEETSVDVAIDRWRKEDNELKRIGISSALQTKSVGALMWQWYAALLPVLAQELEACKKCLTQDKTRASAGDRAAYAPYMEILPLRKVAANTILFTMGTITRGRERELSKTDHEVKISSLITGIGKVIEQECAIDASKRVGSRKQRKAGTSASRRNAIVKQLREQKAAQDSDQSPSQAPAKLSIDSMAWPLDVKVKMGAMLVTKLIETAQLPVTREHPRTKEKMTQLQPAFMHRMKYVQGKRIGVMVPNSALVKKVENEPLGSLLAKRLPMIVEPRPWTSWNEGGYLQYPTPIVRLPIGDKSGKDYFLAADAKGDTKQVYAGLTALSKVPWKINHNVLKVQLQAWNTGEQVANFAPLNPTFNMPAEPEPSTDPEPRRKWLAEVREVENKKTGMHSQRCFQNFQLEIAKAVANETLYFPHNLDFRGRAYPIPPYLNHMGADNARAVLEFGDGKELGEAGLRWLKIHLANVAGYDKASLSEREAYTMENLDDIYDSVRNPLDGRRWWLKSEDAWQTLAACFELTNALDSPDPTKFVSHLPTHQDGTCNGLQHYAALGGDKAGAAQVNLEPGDRPADIYTAVAKAVIEEVEKDAADGNAIAKMLQGKITRKVVKQPVMTNVYGVTFYGAKQQVRKQIEDILPNLGRYDDVNYGNISNYVATKIFKSLGSMFTGAQAIQVWLGTCADRISTCLSPEQIAQLTSEVDSQAEAKAAKAKDTKARTIKTRKVRAETQAKIDKAADEQMRAFTPTGQVLDDTKHLHLAKPLFKSSVTWTTPLRMPVVQPYRSSSSRSITTNLQKVTLQEPQVWDPVSKRKQLQAFPPNFIHSLDATHMMLSALKCNEIGLTFASIHDSFWTHACDIEKMSEVLRDAFVAMHSEDVIGRLHEEFRARYKDHMYLASVVALSKVGSKISALRKDMKSKSGQASELALEKQRLDLLASEDPAERAKGEAMVTPASIMTAEPDESAFTLPAEMCGQTLGDIPEDAHVLGEDAPDAKDSFAATQGAAAVDPSAAEDVVSASISQTPTEFTSTRGAEDYKKRKIYVWLPITFPDVPAKGDFDVKRLKLSKYFFH